MPNWLIIFVISVAFISLFMVGLSLTLIIKGHHIDSEISSNKNMQKLGLKCAVQEARTDEQGVDCDDVGVGCHGSCPSCDSGEIKD